MSQRLNVVSVGSVTPLGSGAEATAAIMRYGYDMFTASSFNTQRQQSLVVSQLQDETLFGIHRHAKMVTKSIDEAFLSVKEVLTQHTIIPLMLCIPELAREHYNIDYVNQLFEYVQTQFQQFHHEHTYIIRSGRTGIATALKLVRETVENKEQPLVCVACVDSYVNREDIFAFGGDRVDAKPRLLMDNNDKGFIPGEAAAALVVSHSDYMSGPICVTGLGFGEESASLFSGKVLRADGLCNAISQAMDDANISPHDADLRLSTVSGEPYFFEEMAIALQRKFRVLKPEYPLWCPADYLGEIGAAAGGIMFVHLFYAMRKRYLQAERVLCQLSGDAADRAAIYLEMQPNAI